MSETAKTTAATKGKDRNKVWKRLAIDGLIFIGQTAAVTLVTTVTARSVERILFSSREGRLLLLKGERDSSAA